jgi:hypothetical protein
MDNYYITEKNQLISKLSSRNANSDEVDVKVDEFVLREWGISGFSVLANELLGSYSAFISRQVPTVNIESVMAKIVADTLGIPFADMLYPDDTFIIRNDYKKSLIKCPIITGHKRDIPIIERRSIAEYPPDGTLLSQIFLPNSDSLINFHHKQRSTVFGNEVLGEVLLGKFFQRCLQLSEKKPDYVYELNGSLAVKKSIDEADLMRSRPSADWYYPLYFLLFIRRVLFESYEGSGDRMIKEVFRKSMDYIYKEIGIVPLVARIPSGTKMLYINPLLQVNNWKQKIEIPQDDNLFTVFNTVSEQLISLGAN